MSALLLRPPAHALEGPNSYRMRLAEANILPFNLVDLEVVCDAKGDAPITQLWRRPVQQQGEAAVWLHSRARWCPGCLGNQGYGRVGWELLFADACAGCGHWLLDICHHCGIPVTWHRLSMVRCSCGANLCAARSTPAPIAVVQLCNSMEKLALGVQETEIPQLGQLSPPQCCKLVRLLGAYGSPQHTRAPQKIASADALDVSWTISTVAAEVLVTWPSGLHHLLNHHSQQASGRANSGQLPGVFGGFYRALYRAFKEPQFDWVRSAFEDYIADHWSGAMGRRNLRMPESLWSRLTWVPLSAAASRTGLSKRRLTDLIVENRVTAARRTTASGREFVMVRKIDIEAMVTLAADEMCLAEASLCLGLKRQRLSRMLPRLCPDAMKSTLHGTPWIIPKMWVNQWGDTLKELAIYDTVPSYAISLDQLLRYGPLDEDLVCTLLRDVEVNLFQPIGRDTTAVGLAGLLFNRVQLLEKYEGQTSALLSIPNTANRMGVKQEVAYALVNLGLLEAGVYISGRRQAQGVSVRSLEKFLRCHVLAADVAKSLGRSSRAVITALSDEGVEPVAGPALGNCRQTVYLRQDLEMIPWVQQ